MEASEAPSAPLGRRQPAKGATSRCSAARLGADVDSIRAHAATTIASPSDRAPPGRSVRSLCAGHNASRHAAPNASVFGGTGASELPNNAAAADAALVGMRFSMAAFDAAAAALVDACATVRDAALAAPVVRSLAAVAAPVARSLAPAMAIFSPSIRSGGALRSHSFLSSRFGLVKPPRAHQGCIRNTDPSGQDLVG